VWLSWLFTSFTSRARSHMVHSQYQHGRGSSLVRGDFLLCWFCFMPTRQMDFVRSSFVVLTCPMGLGPCVRCSTYVVVQPNQKIFNTDSRDVAYQPLVRCVGYRRQHSLRGRFAPTALGLSSSVLGRTAPVLGQSDSVIGQSGPVLGHSDSVIGQSEPVLRYYEK